MDGNGLIISAQVLGIAVMVSACIQGFKNYPFVEAIVSKYLGPWFALGLLALAALVQGFILYSGDGLLTAAEALQVLGMVVAALTTHKAGKLASARWQGGAEPIGGTD